MKLTFNFVKGAVLGDEIVFCGEAWTDYSLEQVNTILEYLNKGYDIRLTDRNNLIVKREIIESVTVHL